jgi:site-specific DNA-methyltransferase (adenine-specific)
LVGVMREDGLQANYQLTPDAIGLWVAFILNRFLPVKAEARVLDLGSGTGNLLATVQQALLSASIQVKGYGVENDDTLITLASGVHALLNQTTELTFGDAVVAPLPDQMDVVIGDLPVGFYPREVPDGFTTVAPDGLSFVHHLLIERGMETVKPGGLGVFLVPAALFESEQATQILSYLQGKAVFFQAFMQFPEKLFANTGSAKAMLILQRAGGDAKQAEPVLLAQVPELAKRLENQNVVAELVAWMTANGLVH